MSSDPTGPDPGNVFGTLSTSNIVIIVILGTNTLLLALQVALNFWLERRRLKLKERVALLPPPPPPPAAEHPPTAHINIMNISPNPSPTHSRRHSRSHLPVIEEKQ